MWEKINLGFILGLLAVTPLAAFIFFKPLGVVHRVMDDAKRNTLKNLSEKYLLINMTIMEEMENQ